MLSTTVKTFSGESNPSPFTTSSEKTKVPGALLPKHRRILNGLGQNLRLARLRRRLVDAKLKQPRSRAPKTEPSSKQIPREAITNDA